MDSGNDSLETSSHSWVRACTSSAGGISAPSRFRLLRSAKKYTLPENILSSISNPREGKAFTIGSTWTEQSYRDNSGNPRKVTLRAVQRNPSMRRAERSASDAPVRLRQHVHDQCRPHRCAGDRGLSRSCDLRAVPRGT